jgi:hypothetical protein
MLSLSSEKEEENGALHEACMHAPTTTTTQK